MIQTPVDQASRVGPEVPVIEVTRAPPTPRLQAVDLARCVAILGMVTLDVVLNACIDRHGHRFVDDGPVWLDLLTGIWNGRASALFVMLAGFGMVLMSKAKAGAPLDPERARRVRRTVLRRCAVLFVIGNMLQASTFWYASILQFYSFFLGFGFLFLTVRSRWLLLVAAALLPAFLGLYQVFDYKWDWDDEHGLARSGWVGADEFWTLPGQLSNYFFNGVYPLVPWFGFVLVGIWVGRLELTDARVRRPLIFGAAATLAGTVGLWELAQVTIADPGLLAYFSLYRFPPMPLYMLSAAAQGVLIIGLCFEIAPRLVGRRWVEPLVATGQMSFTVYLVHILVAGGWRPGLFELMDFPPGIGAGVESGWLRAIVFVPLVVLGCGWWKRHVGAGPMEALLRRLAH